MQRVVSFLCLHAELLDFLEFWGVFKHNFGGKAWISTTSHEIPKGASFPPYSNSLTSLNEVHRSLMCRVWNCFQYQLKPVRDTLCFSFLILSNMGFDPFNHPCSLTLLACWPCFWATKDETLTSRPKSYVLKIMCWWFLRAVWPCFSGVMAALWRVEATSLDNATFSSWRREAHTPRWGCPKNDYT